MTPYVADADFALYVGDALTVLQGLPDESVDCVVTSPPYWGLRDYGTGEWEGGDENCDHDQRRRENDPDSLSAKQVGPARDSLAGRDTCRKCGAQRIDQQLGLEPTPDQYVTRMVEVFREVRRVLAAHGTCWVNLGDSYGSGTTADRNPTSTEGPDVPASWSNRSQPQRNGLKPKDLVGIPWAVARALQQPYYTGKIKDERDRIWLAATVEAEGCLFIHKRKVGQSNGQGYVRKNATYGAGLEVASTDRVVVERCMAITGLGSINEQSPEQNTRRKQTIYRWNLRSNVCREVIRELYPHFIAKQHEARLLLGCPSSGEKAERAHESLKALHQGGTPDIDFAEPESMFEGGWYLRSDIIWSKKPNPMPESVTDRPTKSHEYIFLLTKNPRYWFDQEAVREPITSELSITRNRSTPRQIDRAAARQPDGDERPRIREFACETAAGRNIRSVWEIATQPYPEAHFATFPEELARRCIIAGTSEKGKCPECGAPWERVVEREPSLRTDSEYTRAGNDPDRLATGSRFASKTPGYVTPRKVIGWRPSCFCGLRGHEFGPGGDYGGGEPLKPIPCVVLDPFLGSGTVALVARNHGRHAIGIELSAEYAELAAKRTRQLSLLSEGAA